MAGAAHCFPVGNCRLLQGLAHLSVAIWKGGCNLLCPVQCSLEHLGLPSDYRAGLAQDLSGDVRRSEHKAMYPREGGANRLHKRNIAASQKLWKSKGNVWEEKSKHPQRSFFWALLGELTITNYANSGLKLVPGTSGTLIMLEVPKINSLHHAQMS